MSGQGLASDDGLRVEIDRKPGKPATCKVWRQGFLVFSGQDQSALAAHATSSGTEGGGGVEEVLARCPECGHDWSGHDPLLACAGKRGLGYIAGCACTLTLAATLAPLLAAARAEGEAAAIRQLADDIDVTGYGWTSVVDAQRFVDRLRDRAARIARGES